MVTTRAGRSGQFTFGAVAPGLYLLQAARDGYFPAAFGQRLPAGRGTPLEVTAQSAIFAELRLRHKGAITGKVLDENGVGAAGVAVLAYPARLPLRQAASAVSNDRGVYRIHGLDPGKCWVRSDAKVLEDGSGWLPTFSPQARELRDARVYRVEVDAETPDADISPEPGNLFRISGMIACDAVGPVDVVLSSETGRRHTQTFCKGLYRFEALAPAVYEILATLHDGTAAGFTELFLDRDNDNVQVQVMQLPGTAIDTGGKLASLSGRRQDLAGAEAVQPLSPPRVSLAPGHWELRAKPPPSHYVQSVLNPRTSPRRPWRREQPPDWFEVFLE